MGLKTALHSSDLGSGGTTCGHAIHVVDQRVDLADGAGMAVAIDTLAYARRLRDAGFTEEQAEGQASALAAAMTETLATKQDLRELEARIDARFVAVESRFASVDSRFTQIEMLVAEVEKRLILQMDAKLAQMDARLAALEHRMTLRLGGITVASVGAMTALLKLT